MLAQSDWCRFFDPIEYWFAFVGALLGALVAILFTKHEDKKRKYIAKLAIAERLQFNAKNATGMLEWFSKDGGRPNFLFDTTGIVVWLTLSADILDQQLIKDLNWHRYQFDHLNSKLSVYYVTVELLPASNENVQRQKESICNHLKIVIDETCSLEKRLVAVK